MRALMVCYDPLATTRRELETADRRPDRPRAGDRCESRKVRIPCCYDDPEFAPDMAEVAERTKKTPEQVITAHLASAFKVYVLGFMPGLAYIAGLDPSLYLPRRASRACACRARPSPSRWT